MNQHVLTRWGALVLLLAGCSGATAQYGNGSQNQNGNGADATDNNNNGGDNQDAGSRQHFGTGGQDADNNNTYDGGTVTYPDATVFPDAQPPWDSGIWPDAQTQPPPPDSGTQNGVLCKMCNQDSDCGGNGSYCVADPTGPGACGIACNQPSDCPSGFDCYQLTDQTGAVVGNNCFPANNGSCFGTNPPPPNDAGTTNPPDSGSSSCTSDTWNNFASSIFQGSCSCHGQFSSLSGVQADSSRIKSRIDSGNMPPGGGLSSSDVSRLDKWISCGMPQ